MLSVPWQPPVTHPVVVSMVTTGCKTITSKAKMVSAFICLCWLYEGVKILEFDVQNRIYPQTHHPLICFLIWVLISSLLLHWQVPPPQFSSDKEAGVLACSTPPKAFLSASQMLMFTGVDADRTKTRNERGWCRWLASAPGYADCMFSHCLCGFSPVPSHSPKTCTLRYTTVV